MYRTFWKWTIKIMYSQVAVQLDYFEICHLVLIIGVHQTYQSCTVTPLHSDMIHLNLLNDFDQYEGSCLLEILYLQEISEAIL